MWLDLWFDHDLWVIFQFFFKSPQSVLVYFTYFPQNISVLLPCWSPTSICAWNSWIELFYLSSILEQCTIQRKTFCSWTNLSFWFAINWHSAYVGFFAVFLFRYKTLNLSHAQSDMYDIFYSTPYTCFKCYLKESGANRLGKLDLSCKEDQNVKTLERFQRKCLLANLILSCDFNTEPELFHRLSSCCLYNF